MWGAGCASLTHHQPIRSSISPPLGGSVRREKEEMKEGMQMAIELGTPGIHPALWGQGLVSLGHPSRSVSPRDRHLESSLSLWPCATSLL